MSYIPDTRKANPDGFVYIKGSESANGSRRLTINDDDEIEFQGREDGVWNLTGADVSPDTLKIGRGVSHSTIGNFVLKNDTALETSSITSEMIVDDEGSDVPMTSVWDSRTTDLIGQPIDDTEEIASSYAIQATNRGSLGEAIVNIVRLRTSSTGASADVKFEMRSVTVGSDIGGALYFEKVYPASLFSPDTEVDLELGSGVSLLIGNEFSMTWSSDEAFGLNGRILPNGSFRPWIGWDLQFFNLEELMSFGTGTDRIVVSDGAVMTSGGNVMYFQIDAGLVHPTTVVNFEMDDDGLLSIIA